MAGRASLDGLEGLGQFGTLLKNIGQHGGSPLPYVVWTVQGRGLVLNKNASRATRASKYIEGFHCGGCKTRGKVRPNLVTLGTLVGSCGREWRVASGILMRALDRIAVVSPRFCSTHGTPHQLDKVVEQSRWSNCLSVWLPKQGSLDITPNQLR